MLPHSTSLFGALAIGTAPSRRPPGRSSSPDRRRCGPNSTTLRDAGLPAQELDARLDVERVLLEADRRFVVVRPRIHRQHQEPAPGELGRGEVGEEVAGAVDQQHRDVRRRAGVGLVERALDRTGRERHVESGWLCANSGAAAPSMPRPPAPRAGALIPRLRRWRRLRWW